MKHWFLTPILVLGLASLVQAAPQVENDPKKDYPVTPQIGEWVIVCGKYTGPDAANLAKQLVNQLRSKNQPAFVFNFGDKKRAEMNAEEERWKQQNPQGRFKRWKIEDEFAVFVAGFADMESARDHMNKVIKKLPLPELKLPGGKPAYDEALMQIEDANGHMQMKHIPMNPLMNSFVSRNPTLSATQKKADPFLKVLNEGEDYSLLKCKEPWTMAVQQYGGGAVYVNPAQEHLTTPGFLESINIFGAKDKHQGDALNAAAMQAHETAKLLRQLKFDAYVLHTRTSSIVAIGGFQGPDDPAMRRTAEQVQTVLASVKAKDGRSMEAILNLSGIPFQIPRP